MEKRSGFTLSEVLITLGIIGFVAILTITTVLPYIQKKDDYTRLQKALSVISSAVTLARNDNGGDFSGLANNHLDFANLIAPQMQAIKSCTNSTDSPNCYIKNTDNMYTLTGGFIGGITPYPYAGLPKIVTGDGFVYIFEFQDTNCSGSHYTTNGISQNCGDLMVDINGPKPPNAMGKDIFVILVNKYNTTPYVGSDYYNCDKTQTSAIWEGVTCSWRAINEGGIYYY